MTPRWSCIDCNITKTPRECQVLMSSRKTTRKKRREMEIGNKRSAAKLPTQDVEDVRPGVLHGAVEDLGPAGFALWGVVRGEIAVHGVGCF